MLWFSRLQLSASCLDSSASFLACTSSGSLLSTGCLLCRAILSSWLIMTVS